MSSALAVLAGLLLAGGPRHEPPKPQPPPAYRGPVELRVTFDRRGDRELAGVQRAPQETTPPASGYILSERGPAGTQRIAERVGAARYAPDGAILFVQDDALLETRGGRSRLIARPVGPDFAVDATGNWIAVVRPGDAGTSLELVTRAGAIKRVVAPADGWNGLPVFAPDGSLVFVSGRTGVASFFRARPGAADGEGARQLTNVGIAPAPEGFGPGFVPPPNSRDGLRFADATTLEYDAGGGELWRLDLETGASRRVQVRR